MATNPIIHFKGNVTALHNVFKELRIGGKFRKRTNNHWQYRAYIGAKVNFYQSNGRIFIQGPEKAKRELEAVIIDYASKSIFNDFDTPWYVDE